MKRVIVIVLAIVVSGCAMNRGGRLNETITEYDTDGNVIAVTQTIVDAGRNYATVFAKQEKGATSFLYESTGEGKFRIEAGAVVDKQAGATPQDFGSAITGVVNGIAGIVDAITDNKETE